MPYTRHQIWPDSYAIRYEDRLAGRVHRARQRGEPRWVWIIFISRHVPQVPGVPISGDAVTLDEAASQSIATSMSSLRHTFRRHLRRRRQRPQFQLCSSAVLIPSLPASSPV
jgi:hypothetical protein